MLGSYGGLVSGVKNVPVSEAKSNADGSFEIVFSRSKLERAAWGPPFQEAHTTLFAFGAGFGPACQPLSELSPGQDVTLQLVRDDVPVTGRILDPEGRPVAGAGVLWKGEAAGVPGVYRVLHKDTPVFAVAAAIPAAESDLRPLPAEVFQERLAGGRDSLIRGIACVELTGHPWVNPFPFAYRNRSLWTFAV